VDSWLLKVRGSDMAVANLLCIQAVCCGGETASLLSSDHPHLKAALHTLAVTVMGHVYLQHQAGGKIEEVLDECASGRVHVNLAVAEGATYLAAPHPPPWGNGKPPLPSRGAWNPREGSAGGRGVSDQARILIVDDDEAMRDACRQVLASEGFLLKESSSGEGALDLVGREAFDLLILDLKMPHVDGLEILRRVQQESPGTATVVITGYPSPRQLLPSEA